MTPPSELALLFIYLSGITVVAIFFLYPEKKDASFVRLAMFFLVAFYFAPATWAAYRGNFSYLGQYFSSNESDWYRIGISAWVFIFGFFIRDFLLERQRIKKREACVTSGRLEQHTDRLEIIDKNRVILIVTIAIMLNSLSLFIQPSVQTLYGIRSGEAQGSHGFLLLSMVSSATIMAAFFLSISVKWKVVASILILFMLLSLFYGSPGRTTAALQILLVAIYFFRIKISILVRALPFLTITLIPIIISGKLIIFTLVAEGKIPDLSIVFNYAISGDLIFNDFGHPMVSLYNAPDLMKISGQRWFYDFPHGVLFYLRFFGINTGDSLTYFNTQSIIGVRSSIIPPGYLAFGFAQFSYFGVFVMGAFYRNVYHFISNLQAFRIIQSELFSFYIAFMAANTFYTGEIRVMMLIFFLPFMAIYLCVNFATRIQSTAKS